MQWLRGTNRYTAGKSRFFWGGGLDLLASSGKKPVPLLDDSGWYLGSFTTSPNFWTSPDALQSAMPGFSAIAITRFNPNGVPVYSTYLGGDGIDNIRSLSTVGDSIVIAGNSDSADYPVTPSASYPQYPGSATGVLTCLSLGGELAWSTFIGGLGYWASTAGMCVSSEKAIYVTGRTNDPNLSTMGVHMDALPTHVETPTYIARFDRQGVLICCTYYDCHVSDISSFPIGRLDLCVRYSTGRSSSCFQYPSA
jgi:hypothetical protein